MFHLQSSLAVWFVSLLLLNILDIATTRPVYESNPVTLFLWGRIGIFLAAWVKLGLVALFGILCLVAKRVTNSGDWRLTSQILRGILGILVAFYAFVVINNSIILTWSLLR